MREHSTYLSHPCYNGRRNFIKEGDGLIVGFKGFKDFFANYVADQLKCRGIVLSLPETPRQEITANCPCKINGERIIQRGYWQRDQERTPRRNQRWLSPLFWVYGTLSR